MLIDSNIIIYSFKIKSQRLHGIVTGIGVYCSAISYVEVLGYQKMTQKELHHMRKCFEGITVLPITPDVIEGAVALRQRKRIPVPDAIIAATAIDHGYKLITRNKKDFDWVKELKVINPIDDGDSGDLA